MKIENNFDKIISLTAEGAVEGFIKSGEFVIEEAQIRAPVDTGRLRDSIRVLEGNEVYLKIGSPVDYAYYQHETNQNGGAFYLRNTLIINKDEITAIVLDGITNSLKTL